MPSNRIGRRSSSAALDGVFPLRVAEVKYQGAAFPSKYPLQLVIFTIEDLNSA
jgi:hypothetical protein